MKGGRLARRRLSAIESAVAQYDAAGNGRRIVKWNPPASGPQAAQRGAERMRNRARDSQRNDWAAQAAIQKWGTALVGVGITPRWAADDITRLFAEFALQCDADGVLDFYGMQSLAVKAWFGSGEVFLRRRPRDPAGVKDGYPPVQYQLIESDFVPRLDADTWPDMPAGNRIRQGIELNNYGRRTAYWMYREHPGDRASTTTIDPQRLLRIAADDVAHLYEPTRPGELRGVSPLASVLVRLRASADFEDAALDRQRLANLFVAFLKRTMPPNWDDIDIDPLTGLPKFYSTQGTPMAGLEPGLMQELAPGEEIAFSNPPPATGHGEFLRSTHLGTAAGLGLPNELLTGDIREVSDRTLRVVINEFRRFAEQRQWHNVIHMMLRPMVEWWAYAAVVAGQIRPTRYSEAARPEWNPHGWDYIHPVQDVQGKVIAIEAGLTSKSAEISKRGDDPKKVFAQRAADHELEASLGIEEPPPPALGATALGAGALEQMHQMTLGFGAKLGEAIAGRPIAPPAVTVKNEVNVPPAQVTATVNLPERERTAEFEYDAKGNVVKSTSIEKTLQ